MHRLTLTVAGLLIASIPTLAPAEIILRVDNFEGIPGQELQHVDLVFEATGANATVNEGLRFYDLSLKIIDPTLGIRFAPPYAQTLPAADGFVFSDAAALTVFEPTDYSMLFTVESNSDTNHDITTGKKAARIYFTVDPQAPAGAINAIRFDPNVSVFATRDGVDPVLPVTLVPVIPEPTALFLLGPTTLLALRRRRTTRIPVTPHISAQVLGPWQQLP